MAAISAVLQLAIASLPKGIVRFFVDDSSGTYRYNATMPAGALLTKIFPQAYISSGKEYMSIRLTDNDIDFLKNNVEGLFIMMKLPFVSTVYLGFRDIRALGNSWKSRAEMIISFPVFNSVEQLNSASQAMAFLGFTISNKEMLLAALQREALADNVVLTIINDPAKGGWFVSETPIESVSGNNPAGLVQSTSSVKTSSSPMAGIPTPAILMGLVGLFFILKS